MGTIERDIVGAVIVSKDGKIFHTAFEEFAESGIRNGKALLGHGIYIPHV